MGNGAIGKNLKAGVEVFEGFGGGFGLAFGLEFGQAIGAILFGNSGNRRCGLASRDADGDEQDCEEDGGGSDGG